MTLLIISSFFLLARGHNEPGGGFAGGLLAAAALGLDLLVNGTEAARRRVPIDPRYFAAGGLLMAVLSGGVSLIAGDPFLTGQWWGTHFGTPLLFDVGVYLVVVGVTLMILFTMEESQ
jgi:multicomponent Na+:H+ antiporter subunit B